MGITAVLSMGCVHLVGMVHLLLFAFAQFVIKSGIVDGDDIVKIICLLRWGVLLGVLWTSEAQAAFEFYPVGAQAAGVGDVGVAQINGAEGMFWNPAAVVFGQKVSLFVAHDRPFGLAALERHAVAIALMMGRHGFGGTYSGFGFELYREQVFGGVYGLRVSPRMGMGVRIRSLALTVAEHAHRRWLVFDLGVRVLLTDAIRWGVAAWNVGGVQTGVLGQGGEMGVVVGIGKGADLLASVQKEVDKPTGFGVGVQHVWLSMLVLRVGVGSQPERFSAGFGLQRSGFAVDYAGVWHSALGVSHRVSLRVSR